MLRVETIFYPCDSVDRARPLRKRSVAKCSCDAPVPCVAPWHGSEKAQRQSRLSRLSAEANLALLQNPVDERHLRLGIPFTWRPSSNLLAIATYGACLSNLFSVVVILRRVFLILFTRHILRCCQEPFRNLLIRNHSVTILKVIKVTACVCV